MKRGFREVLLGAVSCVATVGAGGGVWFVDANVALAQQGSVQPPPGADVGQPSPAPAQTPQRPTAPARPSATPPTAPATAAPAAAAAAQLPAIRQIQVKGNQRVEASTVI